MPKKLKCYTRPKKNGGTYTTCNNDIKENKPVKKKVVAKPKPVKKKVAPKPLGRVKTAVAKIEEKSKPKPAPKKTTTKEALQDMPLDIGGLISEKRFEKFSVEDLRTGLRRFGREKNIKQKGINNASRESMINMIIKKNIPISYFKKGGVNKVDIDDILNQAVVFVNEFEKENKTKILKAIVKAKAENRENTGIELRIDNLFGSRGKIKKAIRIYANDLKTFKANFLRLQKDRFERPNDRF